jgi:hypothetical protein
MGRMPVLDVWVRVYYPDAHLGGQRCGTGSLLLADHVQSVLFLPIESPSGPPH